VRLPKLALLLRHLAFTHRMLSAQAGSAAAGGSKEERELLQLLNRLLSEERDPPPLAPELGSSFGQVKPIDHTQHMLLPRMEGGQRGSLPCPAIPDAVCL
jgi:hypothetical protein